MRKRVLSFLLAASAAFCFICSFAPEAQAIVPIGLVQSALASYVTSAGYKMWSENGGGELMVEALSTLYQSWLDSTDPVGALTLGQMSENDYVYLDTSGQIVIRKAAADMFQQFADWIQTEYSVPVGSDTPTEVISASGDIVTFANGSFAYIFNASSLISVSGSSANWYLGSESVGTYSNSAGSFPVYVVTGSAPGDVYLARTPSTNGQEGFCIGGLSGTSVTSVGLAYYRSGQYTVFTQFSPRDILYSGSSSYLTLDLPISDPSPAGQSLADGETSASVAGLGVSLAQAVVDVVGQAKEDDAVVIGVGASAGATAQDIADMVAQGVKAQTLDPSVSITAEAVIDTPVQPYPDIDGLGLPTLGAALVDRFPFCIPWDFVDTVKLLSADPQPINIKVDLIPQRIKTSVGITSDTSFDIDLSGEQYAKIGVFCRWGSLITFCFGLFLLTKRLVWTA